MNTSASPPGQHEAPPGKTSFWDNDWAKGIALLVVLAGAITGILTFIDNRADAAAEAKIYPVKENIELAREDLAYLREKLDRQSDDVAEIKASVARIEEKLKSK